MVKNEFSYFCFWLNVKKIGKVGIEFEDCVERNNIGKKEKKRMGE